MTRFVTGDDRTGGVWMGAYRSPLLSMCLPLATMKRPKRSLATAPSSAVDAQTGNEGLGPKRAVPLVLQAIRPPSLAAYGADISANANTTNHPMMTRAVTAPAITFSFSFVV